MSYIIRVKIGGEYRVVTSASKIKISYFKQPKDLDNEHNRWSWYKQNQRNVLSYKTESGANKMVEKLSKQYPDFTFETFEVEDELGVFECCPSCGGDSVVQTAYDCYQQIFYCDDDGLMVKKEAIGSVMGGYIDSYECEYCGQNLSGYEFNFKE